MTEQSNAPTPLLEQWSAELTTRTGLPLYIRPVNPEDEKLVEHFFAGLSFTEIAAARGVNERTVRRHWDMARALLLEAMPLATPDDPDA